MHDRSRLVPNDRTKLNMSRLANKHCISTLQTDTHDRLFPDSDTMQTSTNKEYRDARRRSGEAHWSCRQGSRYDNSRKLAGRADAPRELFLTRRSFCAICRRYGWADPQLQRRDEYEDQAKYAWRPVVSMRISTGWSRGAVPRPAALPDRRRARAQKAGGLRTES